MSLIDVHIAHLPGENKEWWEQCQRSLVDEPINIHNIDGVVKNIKQTRYNGFLQGTSPYVSFVDPDDYVLPGAFAKCLEVIQHTPRDVCAAYTTSKYLYENRLVDGKTYVPWSKPVMCDPRRIHQLIVYKRKQLLEIFAQHYNDIDCFILPEFTLHAYLATKYNFVAINYPGYVWRIHSQGAHNDVASAQHILIADQIYYNTIRMLGIIKSI